MSEKVKHKCSSCGKSYTNQTENFFHSRSPWFAGNDNRVTICKACIRSSFEKYTEAFGDKKFAFFNICSRLGWYFNNETFEAAEASNDDLFVYYAKVSNTGKSKGKSHEDNLREVHADMKKANSTQDSVDTEDENKSNSDFEDNSSVAMDYERNRISITRAIGYDPFRNENEKDKALLYWMLESLLDETTIEDPFKLPCVIQIVKNFAQLEHLNDKISSKLSEDAVDASALKQLISAKDSLYSKTLAMAKDNGISIINSTSKSKGAGTLSGKIRELNEIGFDEIFVNVIDVETSRAMRQVAEISSEAMLSKLRLDENDYTNIITEQRRIIEQKDKVLVELEEAHRLLRIKVAEMEAGGDG